ncbi:MAG: transglutaminase family protein [Phormidesmis sp.]
MRYRITHTTTYHYSASVRLRPHILRLCPRSDGSQWLRAFDISLSPQPSQQTYWLDANGTTCLQIGFDAPVNALHIQSISEVVTTRKNPFDYLTEPWAVQFPMDYPSSVAAQLRHYWEMPLGSGVDDAIAPDILDLARHLKQEANNNVGYFLTRLVQLIPQRCDYQQRLEGDPYSPAITLAKKEGTCRDFTVLFVAVCRAVGLAARFVSGYQEGDLESDAPHDLHAWAEVYVPGGGWRGFDPTLGLAVGDRHVAIAAAVDPKQAAPVSGTLQPGQSVKTTFESNISLKSL